ncbi:MAG TPA: TldD/PmbA family protein [Methylomirabilota bacterium]|nr:TldD/PmbA family protein [Methylomirabilota bacterium]
MTDIGGTALTERDAAAAADLRSIFGFLRDVVADMERSVPYAAALMRSSEGLRVDLRDGGQTANRLDPLAGVVLTASNGHSLEETATDRTDPDAVRAAAADLVARVRARTTNGTSPALEIVPEAPADADYATPMQIDPASLTLAEKLARYEAVRRQLRESDARAVQASAGYGETLQQTVFVNRVGMVTQQVRRTTLALILFVSDGQQQRYDYFGRGGTGGLEVVEVPPEDLAEMAETAVGLLTARPVPAGVYDIVADPSVSGTIAHEAFGHGVETDMFLKERARAAHYVGQKVGSELVNIIDDATVPGGYGGYFIDDEGQPASPTVIIRDGVFQRGLTDLYSATRLGIPRSANGRRESVHRKAYARMSNTFFARGTNTREELLASLDDGLLVCRALNGMEDPKGWGIQIWTNFAREYKGGKPTGVLYAPVAMTGYVPDVLADVSMVANDFQITPGTCGKGWKELVPNGSGGPHIKTRLRLA